MERRAFLGTAAVAPFTTAAAPAAENSFRFIHFTDTHIQRELRAAEGTRRCFDAIARERHDFALCGGDTVMDAFDQSHQRAASLFDLYGATVGDLPKPVHTVPGNHDVFGIGTKSGVTPTDPMYGKKFYEDRLGARYGSFDHKGWHFIRLDSVFITPQHTYEGRVDDEQLAWLKGDLEKTGPRTPLVVVTHIPIATAFGLFPFPDQPELRPILTVANARQVLALFEGYNLKAVLQGHTHIAEKVEHEGTLFATSGAVCGNWWKGPHYGTKEGYAVLTVRGESITWEYRTYGWHAV